MSEYIQERFDTPVTAETDVLVLGGGPAGVAAAATAARAGAQVTVVERYGYFGGLATGGFIILYFGNRADNGKLLKGGISSEMLDRLDALGALKNKDAAHPLFHAEYLKLVYQRMILEAEIGTHMNAIAVGAEVADGAIRAVCIEDKSGRTAIKAKVVIDCTGDADSARWCGVPYERMEKDALKPLALVYRFGNVDLACMRELKESDPGRYAALQEASLAETGYPLSLRGAFNDGEVWSDKVQITGRDASEPAAFAVAEFEGHEKVAAIYEFYRANVHGFENATWIDTAPQMGVRVTNRIRGRHYLTGAECKAATIPFDTVVLNFAYREGGQVIHGVPFGCLVPETGPTNLLYAGRCVSAAMDAIDRIREIPSCVCLGQAAGAAATLALEAGGDVSAVDAKELRETLLKGGAILE
jgi:FAD-dependent oxidoreductase family protein